MSSARPWRMTRGFSAPADVSRASGTGSSSGSCQPKKRHFPERVSPMGSPVCPRPTRGPGYALHPRAGVEEKGVKNKLPHDGLRLFQPNQIDAAVPPLETLNVAAELRELRFVVVDPKRRVPLLWIFSVFPWPSSVPLLAAAPDRKRLKYVRIGRKLRFCQLFDKSLKY